MQEMLRELFTPAPSAKLKGARAVQSGLKLVDSNERANTGSIFLLAKDDAEVEELLSEIVRCRTISNKYRNNALEKEVADTDGAPVKSTIVTLEAIPSCVHLRSSSNRPQRRGELRLAGICPDIPRPKYGSLRMAVLSISLSAAPAVREKRLASLEVAPTSSGFMQCYPREN
jgi:hypothetical protein